MVHLTLYGMNMIHIIFILIKPFSDPSCPMDGGMEETTPIKTFFH